MNEPLVLIENLSKTFPKKQLSAISDLTVTLPKGQITCLVGPDGAGKTTLLRLIAALLIPTKGKISIAGHDTIKDRDKVPHIIGYMPQKFGLYEDLTVMQNLILYSDLQGVVRKEREEIFTKLLAFTNLASFTKRLAGNLSGGMKQKLGLACALIKKPKLLLLDEPSVGVDPLSRRELWKMVTDLLTEGISVIWSTAYLEEAERCQNALLLNQGKLLYSGPPKALQDRVKGKVFKLTNIQGSRRSLLFECYKNKEVIDATIQGSSVRIVMQKEEMPQISSPHHTFTICEESPRFEDGFIDILGESFKGFSLLAKNRPPVIDTIETPIEVEALTKKFGTFTATENISFKVQKGEIFGLLGPNGAGKSTTFKMLCGLLRPSSGKARVSDFDLLKAPAKARAKIGYMAQKFSLYGTLSVKQNLDFFAGIYNLKGKEKSDAIEQMIQIFSLEDFISTPAELLPLGFKQRLSLAAASMHHPPILFLDEPTSGVDPIIRREFWTHINGLVEKGVTVMVTTHFMDEAEYCDRIALIYSGKVIHLDTPDALKAIAKTEKNQNPTLEDAFIHIINNYDKTPSP